MDDKDREALEVLREGVEKIIKEKLGVDAQLLDGEKAIEIIKKFARSDKTRNKVMECTPCLADAFLDLSKKMNGDSITYSGALALHTLWCCMRKDATNMSVTYTRGLVITLLKFCETMKLLDEEELDRVEAKNLLDLMKAKDFDL